MQFKVNLLQQSGNLKYEGGLNIVIAPVCCMYAKKILVGYVK